MPTPPRMRPMSPPAAGDRVDRGRHALARLGHRRGEHEQGRIVIRDDVRQRVRRHVCAECQHLVPGRFEQLCRHVERDHVVLALGRREHHSVLCAASRQFRHLVRECEHLGGDLRGEVLLPDAYLARGPELADPMHGRPDHEVVEHRLAERHLERVARHLLGPCRIARQKREAELVREGLGQHALAELVAAAIQRLKRYAFAPDLASGADAGAAAEARPYPREAVSPARPRREPPAPSSCGLRHLRPRDPRPPPRSRSSSTPIP